MAFTGKEKTLVAVIGGAVTSGLTSAATFVAPNSNLANVITAVIAVVGFVTTTLGVYLVPNSKVATAVKATGDAVLSVQDSLTPPLPPVLSDADSLTVSIVQDSLAVPPVLSDADVADALGKHEAP